MRTLLLLLAVGLAASRADAQSAFDPFSLDRAAFEQQFAERFHRSPPPAPAEVADPAAGQAADAAYLEAFADYDRAYSPEARARARAMLAALKADAPKLSHEQFVLRAAEIAALADNGHTAIGRNAFLKNTPRLPLRTYWFADGLHVLRALPAQADLLGARIERIDGRTIDEVFAVIGKYVGGTPNHRRLMLIPMLESPGLLAAAGVAREAHSLELSGVLADGSPFRKRIEAVDRDRSAPVSNTARLLFPAEAGSIEGMASFLPREANLPLYLRDPMHLFSLGDLDHGGLYVGLGFNADADEGRVGDFLTSVLERVSRDKPSYVVIDFRMNGGGDYTRTYPFMGALTSLMGRTSHVYALTSGWTFSAAITTLGALKQFASPGFVQVGEPVGDRLVFWAEGNAFLLPNTFIAMNYTTGKHDYTKRCDDWEACFWLNELYPVRVAALEPDVPAPLTFTAYRQLRDPAMDAVLAREAQRIADDRDGAEAHGHGGDHR